MQLKVRIRHILQKEYSGEKAWKAFVYWWLEANGYNYDARRERVKFVDGKYVDGCNDGGIDAIAWPLENQSRNEVLVVQSKYFGQPPTPKELERFQEAIAALNGPRDEFDVWLDGCRKELHGLYRKLREDRRQRRYILIAPCRFDWWQKKTLRKNGIEVQDIDDLTNLERIYSKGKTPRLDEIRMTTATRPCVIAETDGTRVWMFTVAARELGLLYEKHEDLLFAGNIRYALKGQTAQRVRVGIDETLKVYPHELVFSHNGITVTGSGLKCKSKAVVIKSATIVNGAQTVSYFGKPGVSSCLTRNLARVIVKFIDVGNPELLNDIESKVAYRSNNQNKVDLSDLLIELPSLVSLQRFFRRHGVHLERKKGEQKLNYGEPGISKERLAQILAAADSPEGAVKGKRKQELFKDAARSLFSDYDASEKKRAEAVAWARVDDVFRTTVNWFGHSKRKKRGQIAQLASLTVLNRVLSKTGLKAGFLRAMTRRETDNEFIEQFLEKSCKVIVSTLLRCSAQDKKNEPAFYKAVDTVKPAVESATRRSRRKIIRYYRDYLGS